MEPLPLFDAVSQDWPELVWVEQAETTSFVDWYGNTVREWVGYYLTTEEEPEVALSKRQLHLLGVIGDSRSPQDELLDRVNLEVQQGHAALDIPVSHANRRYWNTVYQAQQEAPVYDTPVPR